MASTGRVSILPRVAGLQIEAASAERGDDAGRGDGLANVVDAGAPAWDAWIGVNGRSCGDGDRDRRGRGLRCVSVAVSLTDLTPRYAAADCRKVVKTLSRAVVSPLVPSS